MAQGLCIIGGRVLDPASGMDAQRNIYIRDGVIQRVSAAQPGREWEVMDAGGCWVTPGLIDMHVHLRQPGREDVETIESGTQAAAGAGITGVLCMPNTQPVIDGQTGVEFVRRIAQAEAWCRVFVVGAVTKGMQGEELAEIGEIVRAGGVAIYDAARGLMNAYVARRAQEYSKIFDIPVIIHPEDHDLSAGGVMNEGYQSAVLGLRGTPWAAEAIMVARDAILAELTQARLHVAHVSTVQSVELIRYYKSRGVKITAEATPHHFTLTEDAVEEYDTNTKMSPPLRTAQDRDAIRQGLLDGVIDVVSSSHAPHLPGEKAVEFDLAPNGVVGLETVLPVTLTELHHKAGMKPLDLVALFTSNPARIAKLDMGNLARGTLGDVTVIDPLAEHTIDRETFRSKSRNTPFHGYQARGKAVATIIGGTVVMRGGALVDKPKVWGGG